MPISQQIAYLTRLFKLPRAKTPASKGEYASDELAYSAEFIFKIARYHSSQTLFPKLLQQTRDTLDKLLSLKTTIRLRFDQVWKIEESTLLLYSRDVYVVVPDNIHGSPRGFNRTTLQFSIEVLCQKFEKCIPIPFSHYKDFTEEVFTHWGQLKFYR